MTKCMYLHVCQRVYACLFLFACLCVHVDACVYACVRGSCACNCTATFVNVFSFLKLVAAAVNRWR